MAPAFGRPYSKEPWIFAGHFDASSKDLPESDLVAVPSEAYSTNEFSEQLLTMIEGNTFTTIVFACNVVTVAYFMIRERQSKQKELMRLMGLYDSSSFLSWVMLFAVIKLGVASAVSVMVFGMCVSTLYSRERLGALVAFGALQITGIVRVALKMDNPDSTRDSNDVFEDISIPMLYMLSLLPPVGYIMTMNAYLSMDFYQEGCTWGRIYQQIDRYRVGYGINMIALSFFGCILFYVYLEQIMQHDVGIARSWYFPFALSFWQEVLGYNTGPPGGGSTIPAESDDETGNSKYFEPENNETLRTKRIGKEVIMDRNLTTEFTNASGKVVPAINGLNLTMYNDECF